MAGPVSAGNGHLADSGKEVGSALLRLRRRSAAFARARFNPRCFVVSSGMPWHLLQIALNEAQRLVALERSGLVDTAPEEAFDRIAWLAAHTLDASIALISLLTPTRQFFKARFGLDMTDTPRSMAFCNYTILQKKIFSVEDLRNDPRFSSNPTVTGELGFRFYAGAPIFDAAGFALGSLCAIDLKPRKLDALQKRTLAELAALASLELRFRDIDRRLRELARDGRRRKRWENGHED